MSKYDRQPQFGEWLVFSISRWVRFRFLPRSVNLHESLRIIKFSNALLLILLLNTVMFIIQPYRRTDYCVRLVNRERGRAVGRTLEWRREIIITKPQWQMKVCVVLGGLWTPQPTMLVSWNMLFFLFNFCSCFSHLCSTLGPKFQLTPLFLNELNKAGVHNPGIAVGAFLPTVVWAVCISDDAPKARGTILKSGHLAGACLRVLLSGAAMAMVLDQVH